jgi:hypothetical protein
MGFDAGALVSLQAATIRGSVTASGCGVPLLTKPAAWLHCAINFTLPSSMNMLLKDTLGRIYAGQHTHDSIHELECAHAYHKKYTHTHIRRMH